MTNRDDRDDDAAAETPDRAAILRRRARFVASALTLSLPVAAVSCSDPKPCLNIAQPRETSTTPDTATSTKPQVCLSISRPDPSASASASAPPSDPRAADSFAITADQAKRLGLPAIGFRASMKKGGWTISGPTKTEYLIGSGPPGGPLTVEVRAYDEAASDLSTPEKLVKKALERWSGLDPIEVGAKETVTLGGKQLDAWSFRTGKSRATTNWCIVKAPDGAGSKTGALFMFGTASNETTKPSCKQTLDHEPIAEIVSSLTFE